MARNFAYLESTCARGRGSISHENMGRNLRSEHWKFACHIMSLPHERWAHRMLHWQPSGRGPLGRPAMNWTTKFEQLSRVNHWRDWKEVAADADRWMREADNFIKFCTQYSHASHRLLISSYFLSWFAP